MNVIVWRTTLDNHSIIVKISPTTTRVHPDSHTVAGGIGSNAFPMTDHAIYLILDYFSRLSM